MLFLNDLLNFLGNNLFQRTLSVIILAIAGYWAYRWVIEPVYTALHGMWNFWKMRHVRAAFLEVTPPAHSEKQPIATEQLFSILRRLSSSRETISVEIVSSREEGIRYAIRALPSDIPAIQRHIASYLPEAQFRTLDDFALPDVETTSQPNRVLEIKQTSHYAYPLQPQADLAASDPVTYLAGAMTKLEPDETIVMQVVLAPHYSYWTGRLIEKILGRGYAILGLDNQIWSYIVNRWMLWVIAAIIGVLYNNGLLALQVAILLAFISLFMKREEPTLTQGEQELYAGILAKLQQPLFRADIRMMVIANSGARLADLTNGLNSSLSPLGSSTQALHVQPLYPYWLGQKIGKFKFARRMPSFLVYDANILAASELASIYHFPYSVIKTEGMVRTHSRTLPATLGMKNNEFDVVLGQNNHHGEVTPIGLTTAERERHVFIIGGTGNGKTTMLQYAIVQDIQNGKGVAVVDPHGDMAETLLRHIPEDRINDVVYFNPDDLAHPIGLNLLELTPDLTGDELLREKDLVTESVVSIFRKIFSEDDTGGHRIEYVLRNTIQTALTTDNPTLFTMFDLLNDPAYRKKVVAKLDNKDLVNFWRNELGKAGGFQQVKMVAGITAKIGRFLFSASAKRILEQPRSTINFDDILDGKILICNLSKGLLGEDTSELFGIAVLAKIQLASLRRARMKQAERKPFYLYVDEFQNFATPSFVQMLSEARKYKLYLTMAEQTMSQQEELQMINIILANVGTVVCFRSGNPADEKLVLPLFNPYVEEGEIANLPSYNFYMRVSGQSTQEPLSGTTIILGGGDSRNAVSAVRNSQKHYTARIVPQHSPEPISKTASSKQRKVLPG
jgi:hypothetical protein